MQIEGEGPIEEAWAICRIEIIEADGEATIHHAVHTGPVTARIIEVTRPRAPQQSAEELFGRCPRAREDPRAC